MLIEFECPQCRGHIYELHGLRSNNFAVRLVYWHFLLNPGLAFNELVLGQRIPAELYICKSCPLPLFQRSYIHCRHCNSFIDGRNWSANRAFGNWLGPACPLCGHAIPCLWNWTSRLVLLLTAPVWYLPVKHYRTKLAGSKVLLSPGSQGGGLLLPGTAASARKVSYLKMGFAWGALMALLATIARVAMLAVAGKLTLSSLVGFCLYVLPFIAAVCLLGGLVFGGLMRLALDRKGDRNLHLAITKDGQIEERKETN